MKRIIFACICIAAVHTSLFAETLGDSIGFPFHEDKEVDSREDTQTLLGSDEFTATGFGGPYMSTMDINGSPAYFVGGRGGAIFNRTLIIGGGGCGLVYPLNRGDITGIPYQGEEKYVHLGYGGVLVGFNMFQKNVINLSFTSLVGAGGLSYSQYIDDDHEQQDNSSTTAQEFFVCEPTMLLHLNVTQWVRVGAGVSYRYTKGIHTQDLKDDDFKGWSTVFAVDFGWF